MLYSAKLKYFAVKLMEISSERYLTKEKSRKIPSRDEHDPISKF